MRDTYEKHGVAWQPAPAEDHKSRGRALDSILHELLLTEFDLATWETVKARRGLQLLTNERRYHRKDARLIYTWQTKQQRLIPDAGFVLAFEPPGQPRQLLLHLVELDNGTMPVPRLLEKWQAYAAWSTSTDGKEHMTQLYRTLGVKNPRPSFRLLVVAHDKRKEQGDDRRALDLLTQALDPQVYPALRDRFWLTTVAALREHQADKPPLKAPLWLRARDAKTWHQHYRAHNASLTRGKGQKPYNRQREFVAEKLPTMPRHELFPRL